MRMDALSRRITGFGVLLATLAICAGAAEPPPAPASGVEHVKRGIELSSQRQFGPAIAEFSAALELDPDAVPIRLMRATTYGSNRQWPEAGADFEAALKQEPENPMALSGMGIVKLESGRPLEAIDLLRRSLDTQDNISTRRTLINAYLAARNYDSALVEMDRVAQQNPAEGMYLLRIETLLKAGRDAEVEAVIVEAVAANPGPDDGEFLTGLLHVMAGQNDRALPIADEAIRKAPTANRYYQRALAEKNPARQRSDLQEALKLSPKHMLALALLADVNLKLKDFRAATRALDQIETVATGKALPADYFRMRGDALTGLRDKAGAARAYASAREKMKDGTQLNSMCWAKATRKSAAKPVLQEALKDCDAALALLPECWQCQDSRGLVLLRLKRFKDAIDSHDTALRGNPKQAHSLYGRGIARLRSKLIPEGNADISSAIALTPDIARQFKEYGIRR